MSARQLLQDLSHALTALTDVGEDGEVALWDRRAVFALGAPETRIWAALPCADNPPRAWLLMIRTEDEEPIWELLWQPDADTPFDSCPVVEVRPNGDTQVLALNAADYVDALLYTGGALGGGSEDDLADAREDAVPDALDLSAELIDELDRPETDVELLGERWDEAQDQWGDAWSDAVEGLEA